MAAITVKVTDEEKKFIEDFAKLVNKPISRVIRDAVFDELDAEYEMTMLKAIASKDNEITYTFDEVCKKTLKGEAKDE